jgi:hypothetical protein
MFCKKCGKEIPDDSNFCQYCGVSLSNNKANDIIKKGKTLITIKHEKKFGWGLYKIKIYIDGSFIKEIKSGKIVSFEIENGRHIIFCEAKRCERSESVEINADSNEIYFSATFNLFYSQSQNYKVILTKTMETEKGTWE